MSSLDVLRQGIIAPPGKRKRTKKEAKKRIRSIPTPPPRLVPPILRPAVVAGPRLAEVLVDIDPFGLTAPEPAQTPTIPTPPTVRGGISAGQIGERIAQGAQLRQERMQMTTEDTIRDMVNDPMITITEEMLPIINDPGILMDMNGVLVENRFAQQFRRDELLQPKKKRKVSKYQKELGRQLKMLKKKHPRTPITKLMRKAHAATRRALK